MYEPFAMLFNRWAILNLSGDCHVVFHAATALDGERGDARGSTQLNSARKFTKIIKKIVICAP